MDYAKHMTSKQTEKDDPRQVKNSAGGFTFQIDQWKQLERFLILGTEGGTYYAKERALTRENAANVQKCIRDDGAKTINTIVAISTAGRAPKNDPSIFALALAASADDANTRRMALEAMPAVCRIGTHLFHFYSAVTSMRGWGPVAGTFPV